MEIPNKYVQKSSVGLSTKNAWALYARRRWPVNTLKSAMAEFDLSEGEARGLVYATIGQAAIDKILDHPRGGFALGLLILQIRCQTSIQQHIEHEKVRLDGEAKRLEADRQTADRLAVRLRDLGDLRPGHAAEQELPDGR